LEALDRRFVGLVLWIARNSYIDVSGKRIVEAVYEKKEEFLDVVLGVSGENVHVFYFGDFLNAFYEFSGRDNTVFNPQHFT
jgi:hypothetical protein